MSATGLNTFYNSQHRQIYTGAKGGMYVMSHGRKVYGVKAHFKKTAGGVMMSVEVKRRARKDKGVPRKKKSPVASILPNPYIRKTRRDAGVPRKKKSPVMSILQNPYIRKTRRDAGIRRKKSSSAMSVLPNPYIRKTRKNKGVRRGSRKPKAMGVHTRFMYSPGGTMM